MTVLKRKLEKSPKKHTHTPIKAISALAFKNVSLLKIKKEQLLSCKMYLNCCLPFG